MSIYISSKHDLFTFCNAIRSQSVGFECLGSDVSVSLSLIMSSISSWHDLFKICFPPLGTIFNSLIVFNPYFSVGMLEELPDLLGTCFRSSREVIDTL